MLLARTGHLLVEPVGALWAAYSPLSGRTSLLNDLSAAVLEVLEEGPQGLDGVCAALCQDSGESPATLRALVEPILAHLIDAGLMCVCTRPNLT